jgi:hypothetical protein
VTSSRHPLGRWVLAVTLAESLGFVVPALAGVGTGGRYWAMVAAGAAEGMLLGAGQVVGAGRGVLPPARWIAATAIGAAVAWALGMVPTIVTLQWTDPPVLAGVVGAAALALLAMPVLQWAATGFRRGLSAWVPVSAGAWAAGLVWTALPSPFIDERTPTSILVMAYAGAGVLMATTVAVLTGLALRRLPGFRRPIEPVRPPASAARGRAA